jgi:hypothetical protein
MSQINANPVVPHASNVLDLQMHQQAFPAYLALMANIYLE